MAAKLTSVSPEDDWMAAMRQGDYVRAWRIADVNLRNRIACGEPVHVGPRHLQRIWNGEPLTQKRVLVRCYHGLGDTVQFIRFAATLRPQAREVIVWAQPQLMSLVSTAAGVDRVLPLHDGAPDVAFDCDIEIMELAHALRVDARSIACRLPYVFPRPAQSQLPDFDGAIRVGLVWRAGDWNRHRSIPTRLLSGLAHVSGVGLFSLQRGPAASEAWRISARDVSSEDVAETAATLRRLDLLITVDTFLAHLAGALGIPTWLMLHATCDWRWTDRGEDCVWYPTMRLFRQHRAGDWTAVVDEISAALERFVANRSSTLKSPEQTQVSDVRPL